MNVIKKILIPTKAKIILTIVFLLLPVMTLFFCLTDGIDFTFYEGFRMFLCGNKDSEFHTLYILLGYFYSPPDILFSLITLPPFFDEILTFLYFITTLLYIYVVFSIIAFLWDYIKKHITS